MNGLEVLRQLKEGNSTKAVPVLFYSADDDPKLIQEAKTLGADDWLVKGSIEWLNLPGKVGSLYASPA